MLQGLNLHSGGELVPYEMLEKVATPLATATHHPLPHHDLVQMARYALQFYGHEIVAEHHALDKEGMRYFGILELRSDYGNYIDLCGLRNSHDKAYPVGISFGAKVFVCSNLSFIGDHVIKRKHTQRAKRDLPGLVAEVVEPLREERRRQHEVFDRYRLTALNDNLADHAIMSMYRQGVVGVQRIADVHDAWQTPPHDWGEKSAWRLFNAATFALTGKVAEDPSLTRELHHVIDGVCEVIH